MIVVVFEELQPKNIGRVFSSRFTKVFWSGIAGKDVSFARFPLEFRLLWYAATRDVPLGQ